MRNQAAALASERTAPSELAKVFLRLGTISFGGPAAHIAMMEDELVRRRSWLTRERFLDLLGAVNLIPGPNSTEMALYIGLLRGSWLGLLVAGASFILPSAILVAAIAKVYVCCGTLPQAVALLYGTKPVIIAVVVQALWSLGRTAVKTKFLALVGVTTVVLAFFGVNQLLLLFVAGAVVALSRWSASGKPQRVSLVSLLSGARALPAGASGAAAFGLWPLFLFFLKVGTVLFGSGYVLLAFLRADLVEHWHWLTEAQLLDAVAVSQVTPGPVFTVATFIGYLLAGPPGALLATTAIFLPGVLFVAASGRLVPWVRQSNVAGGFLDGVIIASLALMAVVTWQLGRAALVDLITVALAGASAVLLMRYRINAAWLVLSGALIGLVASTLAGR